MAAQAHTSRRAFMGVAAALPLAFTPAALAAAQSPDAELLSLGAERIRLRALRQEAWDLADAAMERYFATMPRPPEVLQKQPFDYGLVQGVSSRRGYYLGEDLPHVQAALERHRATMAENGGLNTRSAQRCEAILAALDAYEPQRRAAHHAAGVDAAEDVWSKINNELGAVEDKIIAVRAKTPAGLAVKAQMVHEHMRPPEPVFADEDYDVQIIRSLLADLGVA